MYLARVQSIRKNSHLGEQFGPRVAQASNTVYRNYYNLRVDNCLNEFQNPFTYIFVISLICKTRFFSLPKTKTTLRSISDWKAERTPTRNKPAPSSPVGPELLREVFPGPRERAKLLQLTPWPWVTLRGHHLWDTASYFSLIFSDQVFPENKKSSEKSFSLFLC